MSPPSDNVIFDNQCYATTPSSSNGNSDMEQPNHCNSRRCNGGQGYQQNMQSVSTPGSPTSRLLLEYEMHLRNTLAKGMDAESYSLRTFEALLTQSMENLGKSPLREGTRESRKAECRSPSISILPCLVYLFVPFNREESTFFEALFNRLIK